MCLFSVTLLQLEVWPPFFAKLPITFVFCSQVKVLFVRNLASTVTEEILEKAFSQFGKLERVKKLKDYAFIHFEERDGAVKVCKKKLLSLD